MNGLMMFSVNVTDGASKVPLAVLMIADSNASKNMTRANMGVWLKIRSGSVWRWREEVRKAYLNKSETETDYVRIWFAARFV